MGWRAERGWVNHLTLSDQQQRQQSQKQQQSQQQQQPQQQQQQQWGPSPRAMHAFDLYRACLAAGQQARFTVQQRPGGEYIYLSSSPPPQQHQLLEEGGLAGSRTKNGQRSSEPGGRTGIAPQQPGFDSNPRGKVLLRTHSSNRSRRQPAAAARRSAQAQWQTVYSSSGQPPPLLPW